MEHPSRASIIHPNRNAALYNGVLDAGFANVINGTRSTSSQQMVITDPVTGETLAHACKTDEDGLTEAVQAAHAAFPNWSQRSWAERRHVLSAAIEVLKTYREELVTLLTAENGRPSCMARFEVDWILDTYATHLLQLELGDSTRTESGLGTVTQHYLPLGVVAAISPWNLPFWLSFTKVLPALLVGNTVVLKPAPYTPLTVLRAVDHIKEILPPGTLNAISGSDELGPLVTAHPAIRTISFTGSSETGRKVFASAASTLKHLTLELGGNDPGIVLADANVEQIAPDLFRSMFTFSGQGCITLKRLFVHADVYENLATHLVQIARQQKLGDGFDPEVTMGPIQNRPQFRRLDETWREIQESGAAILFRGEVPSSGAGLFFPVTILDNPPADAPYVLRENFGPIRTVIRYDDLGDAIRMANATPYGLGASVWGNDERQLLSVARQLDAGTVWINQHLNVHPNVPKDARKDSGIGSEFGIEALRNLCSVQVIARSQEYQT